LKQGECGFYCVRVDVAAYVFFLAMINGFMLALIRAIFDSILIAWMFIRNQHVYLFANVLLDESAQSSCLAILGGEEAQLTASLANSDDNCFIVSRSTSATRSPIFPAYKG